jgi:hypothetical protein
MPRRRLVVHRSGAVQAETRVESAWFQRLKMKHDQRAFKFRSQYNLKPELKVPGCSACNHNSISSLSTFASNIDVRPSITVTLTALTSGDVALGRRVVENKHTTNVGSTFLARARV